MKIGDVKKKIVRPDVIPIELPKEKPIPAPDIFIKKGNKVENPAKR